MANTNNNLHGVCLYIYIYIYIYRGHAGPAFCSLGFFLVCPFLFLFCNYLGVWLCKEMCYN
jgi:hypothetical protein